MKPSEEKKFLKYYKKEAINNQVKDMKIVDYMKENNLFYLDKPAISCYAKKQNYSDFFETIDKAIRTYKVLGIKKGDFVAHSSPNFIEGLVSFYALNAIGAIPNMISPLATTEEFENHLKEAPIQNVVLFDQNLSQYQEVLKKGGIKNTILLSPNIYLPKKIKYVKSIADKITGKEKIVKDAINYSKNNNPIYFTDALGTYSNQYQGLINSAPYNFDDTALLLHTGGTTGFPKAVEVTNNNFNSMIHQYEITIPNIQRGDKIVTVLPMNIGFGLCNNMVMPNRMGVELILHPTFNPKEVYDIFENYKPNHFMATSTFFKYMMNDKRFNNKDLSYIKSLCYGGEEFEENEKERFNRWLEEHNAKGVTLRNGYGENEGVSSFEYEQPIGHNKYKTIPLVHNNRKITKVEVLSDGTIIRSDEELKRGEEGEVCLTGPTLTKGYRNNKEETDEAFRIHSDGKRWLHSGDLGYVDKDDGLVLSGRLKRIYLTIGDNNAPAKFFPNDIEKCISELDSIDEVCVVGVPELEKTNIPVAYVVLKDTKLNKEIEENKILEICNKLSSFSRPTKIYFKECLPKTNIGKTDYITLTKEAIAENENNVYQKDKPKKRIRSN